MVARAAEISDNGEGRKSIVRHKSHRESNPTEISKIHNQISKIYQIDAFKAIRGILDL